jgi:hypothetical protein
MMQSKVETDMKDIMNPMAIRAHNIAYKLYDEKRGKGTYVSTFSQYSQVRLAICQQINLSFDELGQIPEKDLMALLEAVYSLTTDTLLTQLKKAVAK